MSVDLAEPDHSILCTFITVGTDGNINTKLPQHMSPMTSDTASLKKAENAVLDWSKDCRS